MNETPQVLLTHYLKTLKLPTFLKEYGKVSQQCAAEGVDYENFLLRLSEQELIDRQRRMVERRIKQAKFPTLKSLDSFNFTAIPSLNKAQVMELARCEFIDRKENVIALGNSGTAKAISQRVLVWQHARKDFLCFLLPPPRCLMNLWKPRMNGDSCVYRGSWHATNFLSSMSLDSFRCQRSGQNFSLKSSVNDMRGAL